MKVVSFFSGCGGLDLGFRQAGFDVIWANELDKNIHATYKLNHPSTVLCEKDIRNIDVDDIPDGDGLIGGSPCQSWSVGGKGKGLRDERGLLFLKYIEIIRRKHPKFFVIENVFGMLMQQHLSVFLNFVKMLEESGYNVSYTVLNASDYKIPQDRKRVFIVGISTELNCKFSFPAPENEKVTLRQAIGDIMEQPKFYSEYDCVPAPQIYNHDVYEGVYDGKYMARNRVRTWEEQSFTIQAQARNTPIHPQAPVMRFISSNRRIFEPGYEHLYRRLSVRECAHIQTFPDSFIFLYQDIMTGYKMVGNAVPPRLAKAVALSVKKALAGISPKEKNVLVAYYRSEYQLARCEELSLFYFRANLDSADYNPLVFLPRLLLLVKGKYQFLYELDNSVRPSLATKEELQELGFTPHNKLYWVIRLSKKVVAKINYETKWKDKRKRSPYLEWMDLR